MTLLTVEGLSIEAPGGRELVRDVALDVEPGEIVGIVGESGSGKTMTALSLLGLLPDGVRSVRGSADLGGEPFLRDGRLLKRPNTTMIFQNPTAALNPTMRIGAQLVRLLAFLDARGNGKREGRTSRSGGASAPSRCWTRWASRIRARSWAAIRTSFRAA